jgi:transcriptional regulator with XRE-family HTH domain
MSTEAAGAYIKYLREHLGISQSELARRAHTSSSQINRIEEGKGETRASLMAAISRVLEASAEDLFSLLTEGSASEETGRRLAISWLDRRKGDKTAYRSIRPEIVELVARLSEFQLGRWVEMGERILEE